MGREDEAMELVDHMRRMIDEGIHLHDLVAWYNKAQELRGAYNRMKPMEWCNSEELKDA